MGSIVFETRDIHNYRVCIGMNVNKNKHLKNMNEKQKRGKESLHYEIIYYI